MLRVSSCHQGSRGLSTPAAARFSPHAIRALNSSKNYVSSRSMGIDLKSHLNCPPVIFSPRQPLRTRTNGWPFGDGDKNTDQVEKERIAKQQEEMAKEVAYEASKNVKNGGNPITVMSAGKSLMKVRDAWNKVGKSKDGLDLEEVTELINSKDITKAMFALTNVEPKRWTEKELEPFYLKADEDKSGKLSQNEFFALYLATVQNRVTTNPLVMAEALLGFIDINRDGKIAGGELKVLMSVLGFPIAMLMPIPDWVGIDYRGMLKGMSGGK